MYRFNPTIDSRCPSCQKIVPYLYDHVGPCGARMAREAAEREAKTEDQRDALRYPGESSLERALRRLAE